MENEVENANANTESEKAEPCQKVIDLDELFGFTEARKKLEYTEQEPTVEPDFMPYRIFINHVDSFHGYYFSEFLSDQIQGTLKSQKGGEEGEEEEVQEEEQEQEVEEEETENEDQEWKPKKEKKPPPEKHAYEIIGTAKDPKYVQTESVKEVLNISYKTFFLERILKCGFIIYDITSDNSQINEALWTLKAIESHLDKLQETAPKAFKKMKDIRHFILISTVMTWALTKPIDPDDPVPFTETDFRKRKPHPNYKEHIDLEKEVTQVGKKYKDKYKTLVIAAGITYGGKEDILHFLFKMAWLNEPSLPIFLPGNNKIPLIHVKDLTSVIYNILEKFPEKRRYILAVEMAVSSLKNIVKAISLTLSTGKCKNIRKEEAFFNPEITQTLFDTLTIDLNMEPVYILENMNINWVSEVGFIDNIQHIVMEYKEAHNLKPLKIVLHGPPAVGKTIIANRLCSYYKIHYLHVADLIKNTIEELKKKVESLKDEEKEEVVPPEEVGEEGEEAEEEEVEIKENVEEIQELINEIEANMDENDGRLDDSYVIRFFKEKMSANPCQNQGYMLDGFPQLTKEAKALFNMTDIDEELVEEEEGDELTSYNKKIMPEFVISLCAPDDLLYSHVMGLPEKEVQGTIYTEENMVKRVAKFRANNTDDATVLNYFDELEIHPLLIDTEGDTSPLMESTFTIITNKIGKPRNFGIGDEDVYAEQARRLLQEKESDEVKGRNEAERKAFEEQQAKMEEWANLLDALKEEEEELLAIQGIPVRHYLMRYIFPVLTRGLLEVARVRPDDPVDYLAEYLFRENPEGKMFNPDYAQAGEELASLALLLQDSLIKTDSLLDTTFIYSHSQEMDQIQMGSFGVFSKQESRATSKGELLFEKDIDSISHQSEPIHEKSEHEKMTAERVDCFVHEADLDENPLTPVVEENELEDKLEDKLNGESDIINNNIDTIEENSELELIE